MLPSIDLSLQRAAAPDSSGAAASSTSAADAALFAAFLDQQAAAAPESAEATASEDASAGFLAGGVPTADPDADRDAARDDSDDDEADYTNDSAFLMLTLAFPRPLDTAPALPGDSGDSFEVEADVEQVGGDVDGMDADSTAFAPAATATVDGDMAALLAKSQRLSAADKAALATTSADAATTPESPAGADQTTAESTAQRGARGKSASIIDAAQKGAAQLLAATLRSKAGNAASTDGDAAPTGPRDSSRAGAATGQSRDANAAQRLSAAQEWLAEAAGNRAASPAAQTPSTFRLTVAVPTADSTSFGNSGGDATGDSAARSSSAGAQLWSAVRAPHLLFPNGFAAALETAAAPTAGASVTASLPPDAELASSLVQGIRMQMRDGVGSAVINLNPEHLGAVRVALQVSEGTVTATVHAENPQVRAWMEANESTLRQGLQAQGLDLDRLIVTDEAPPEEREASEERRRARDEQQPRSRQPRRDPSARFEIIG